MMTVMTLSVGFDIFSTLRYFSAFRYFSTLRYFSAFRYFSTLRYFSTPRYFCYAIIFDFTIILRYCGNYYQILVVVRCVSLAKMGAAVTIFFECVTFCPSKLFSFVPPPPETLNVPPFPIFFPAGIAVAGFPQSRVL